MSNTLALVGLGPGDPALLPPLAQDHLRHAEALVGYGPYLAMIPNDLLLYPDGTPKRRIVTGMRHERERVLTAIELAKAGTATALVASGDPGIYALAGLVLECLETEDPQALSLTIVPGISALMAAASLLGAPLGHDFACVSLSDLLTPWNVIEQRIRSALAGDFVLVCYNPRSKGRPDHIARALALARNVRSGTTPVGIVRNAYRPEQRVVLTCLDAVDVTMIDMLTIVFIGSSESRQIGSYFVTPRGYTARDSR